MDEPELCLYWLNPAAWEELEVEIIHAIRLDEWLKIQRRYGYRVTVPAEEALVTDGPGRGGQVIVVETPAPQFFIAPPAVFPYLSSLLPPEDYQFLLNRTPAAAALAATPTAAQKRLVGQEGS